MRLFDYVRRADLGAETARMLKQLDMSECVVIDAQPVCDWWDAQIEAMPKGEEALRAVARCSPPFGLSFVEWRPAVEHVARDAAPRMEGIIVWRTDEDDGGFVVFGASWFHDDTGATGCMPCFVSLAVAADGTPDWDSFRVMDWPEVEKTSDERFKELFGESKLEMFHRPTIRAFVMALTTFRFMHARNVRLIERQATRQERRLAEREGQEAPTRFYTLDIAPITKRLADEGQLGAVGLAKALHICRGHFADYTKGRGLFGKYKVEVFVPEHFKGRASRGRVVKDYRVIPQEVPCSADRSYGESMSKGSTRRPEATELIDRCGTVTHRFPIGLDTCECGMWKRDGSKAELVRRRTSEDE